MLAKQQTAWARLARLFSRGTDLTALRSRVSEASQQLLVAEAQVRDFRVRAETVWDFVIDYPPDWSARAARVVARAGRCAHCGTKVNLQAHHVIPLSMGGTNKASNLQALCERCHQGVHHGRTFSYEEADGPPAIAGRVQLINEAIAAGRDVQFGYKKFGESAYHKRTVTPWELVEIDRELHPDKTLCLRGHCHLRGGEALRAQEDEGPQGGIDGRLRRSRCRSACDADPKCRPLARMCSVWHIPDRSRSILGECVASVP